MRETSIEQDYSGNARRAAGAGVSRARTKIGYDGNMAEYPILEFDPSRPAVIEPSQAISPIDAPEHCVLCFFSEALARLGDAGRLRQIAQRKWEDGLWPLYEMSVDGRRLAVAPARVGSATAAGMLEEAIALGCRKFIVCGGAGVLDRGIAVGHLLVPVAAVRDEGTSYHYLPPGREVNATPAAVAAIKAALQARGVHYQLTKTWTTDAPYRETRNLIERRRAEGCLTVEMEAAAFFAVAEFRGVTLGQILYAGDDVSGTAWDAREWDSRHSIREELFWLAADACLRL